MINALLTAPIARSAAPFALLVFMAGDAFAWGWRGGSGHMVPLWQAILTAIGLFAVYLIWKIHPGKLIAAFVIAVIVREVYVGW